MHDAERVITKILAENDRSIKFSFPLDVPNYLPVTVIGWAPANEDMMLARERFLKFLKGFLILVSMKVILLRD